MAIRIDKRVPIPKPETRDRSPKYPWADMKVGDSFFVAGVTQKAINSSAHHQTLHGNGTYSTRVVVENGVKGVRCWKVKA